MKCGKKKNNLSPKIRTCTDGIWLAIFTIFWLMLVVIAIFSFVYGSPFRILNGYDSFGNTCGTKYNDRYKNIPFSGINTLDRPYLFSFNIKKIQNTVQICIKDCPRHTISSAVEILTYFKNTGVKLCRYDFNMSLLEDPNIKNPERFFHSLGPCPELPVFECNSVRHHCIPTKNERLHDVYRVLNSWSIAQQLLSDIYRSLDLVIIISGISIILSFSLVALIYCLSRIISLLICVFVIIATTGLSVALWYTYYNNPKHFKGSAEQFFLDDILRNEQALLSMAVLATLAMILVLITPYILKEKIPELSILFEEAGKCIIDQPGLFIAPILASFVLFSFLIFWIMVVGWITTASSPVQNKLLTFNNTNLYRDIKEKDFITRISTEDIQKTIFRVQYTDERIIRHMFWIYIIGLIWTVEFIFGCQQFCIATAVSFWYFRKPVSAPSIYAIKKLIKYHLGTVAKGSLVITIFKIPRLILTLIYVKLKKSEENSSVCAECCLKLCFCNFWMLEKFIRFINHNAYTVVAIESINFCPAAGIAWNSMAQSALQMTSINSIGDLVLFLSKLLVTTLSSIIGILLLRNRPDISIFMAPVIFIIFISFFNAHIILTVFEMVIDTLFICLCEDKTVNGRAGRWTQSNLSKLIGEEPLQPGEDQVRQAVELMPVNVEPFIKKQHQKKSLHDSEMQYTSN